MRWRTSYPRKERVDGESFRVPRDRGHDGERGDPRHFPEWEDFHVSRTRLCGGVLDLRSGRVWRSRGRSRPLGRPRPADAARGSDRLADARTEAPRYAPRRPDRLADADPGVAPRGHAPRRPDRLADAGSQTVTPWAGAARSRLPITDDLGRLGTGRESRRIR